MHDLQPQWIPILKTHCTAQRAKELTESTAVRRFVCSDHFIEGTLSRISVEHGLEYLKKEFCGPSYLKQGLEGSRRGRSRSKSGHDVELFPNAKSTPWKDPTRKGKHGKARKSEVSADDAHLKEREGPQATVGTVQSLIGEILKNGTPESIEELRSWLSSSEIGAEIAVGVTGSIVAGARARLQANYYPRPLLCVALDTLDAFKIKVHDKELASQAEVSVKTVQRAREERLYV